MHDEFRAKEYGAILVGVFALCKELEKAEDGNSQRDRAIRQLGAVIKFLDSIPGLEANSNHLPLVQLHSELHDLDTGIVGGIVEPAKRLRHSPLKGEWLRNSQIFVISLIELLFTCGHMELPDACKFVAKALPNGSFPIKGRTGTPLANTLENLREEIRKSIEKCKEIERIMTGLKAAYEINEKSELEQLKKIVRCELSSGLAQLGAKSESSPSLSD